MAAVKQNLRRTSSGDAVGQPTRGYKTRNNKRTDAFIVNRRKKDNGRDALAASHTPAAASLQRIYGTFN